MIDITIADIKQSVTTGEEIEEDIVNILKKESHYQIIKMPPASDLDRFVIPPEGQPFFLEIKIRSRWWKEAISPIRKWQIAKVIKDHLKLDTYALFYFLDIKKAYLYDLTMPVRTGYLTRHDRRIEGEYGYYKAIKEVKLKEE